VKKTFSSTSQRLKTPARLCLLALVILAVALLPVGARASGQPDLTVTPEVTATPEPTSEPAVPADISWLSDASSPADLASDESLAALAGKLIFRGLVDASSCSDNGMLNNGYASACGERIARPAVILWQNQFDAAIFQAAKENNLPPYLLKTVLVQESQFWPARHLTIYGYYEYGLGHITQMGADTLLRWNADFSSRFCHQVFDQKACEKTYAWMPANQQAVLRGAVLQTLSADCGNCRGGVDLQRARDSLPVIAAALRSNYNHVQWLLAGFSARTPNRVYERSDLWRLTLAGYNAGPGCLTTAISRTNSQNLKLTWKNLSAQFDKGCQGALEYVNNVTSVHPANPQALAEAQSDTSLAAGLVFAGLGMTPAPMVTETPAAVTPVATDVLSTTPAATLAATAAGTLAAETSPTLTAALTVTDAVTPAATETSSTLMATLVVTETGTPAAATATPTLGASVDMTTIPAATPASSATEAGTAVGTAPVVLSPAREATSTATPAASEAASTVTETLAVAEATATPTLTAAVSEAAASSIAEEVLTATATTTPVVTAVAPTAAPGQPDAEIVVKFNALVPEILSNAVVASAGGQVSDQQLNPLGLTVIQAPAGTSGQVLAALQNNLLVEYAESDQPVQALYTPNDPGFAGQGNLLDLHVPQAWDLTRGEGVTVAVIDTGIDLGHPDLSDAIWSNLGEIGTDASGNDKRTNGIDDDQDGYVDNWQGWNFLDNTSAVTDLNGHGTHSAGIIAARMDNQAGIAGIAPLARIMPLKALDNSGSGTYLGVAKAIVYAVDHGAKIINLGFGGSANSAALLAATDYAYAHGVTIVAAAGNGGANAVLYPAANPHVLAVSALDASLVPAAFSNYGAGISLSAPGSAIYSTWPSGQYGQLSGTSMSAAEISGVAALLASQPQFNTPDAIRAALVGTALDLGDPGFDVHFGNGLVQAYEALYYGGTLPTPDPTTPTATFTPGPTPTGGVHSQAIESLWGTSGDCNGTPLVSPGASTDGAFDSNGETCSNFMVGSTWTYSAIQNSVLPSDSKISVNLVVRLQGDASWTDDPLQVDVSTDGTTWSSLTTQIASTAAYSIYTADVTANFPTIADVNNAQVRFTSIISGLADTYTLDVDEVKLEVNAAPVANPDGYTTQKNTTLNVPIPGVLGNDTDANGDALTAAIVSTPASGSLAYFNADGSLSYAPATDTHGMVEFTYSASDGTATPIPAKVNILVEAPGPHGNFDATTDACALCHRTHSAASSPELLSYPGSTFTSNDFCLSCHSTSTVPTHSNNGAFGDASGRQEPGVFELLCTQCHDPHGGTGNLAAIRSQVVDGSLPSNLASMMPLPTPVVFTALMGSNSLGNTGDASALCVTCHLNYPSMAHPGGANHTGTVAIDRTGQSCVACHAHKNGFMPVP
jgi:predicted CXXCH cytochrome family protein